MILRLILTLFILAAGLGGAYVLEVMTVQDVLGKLYKMTEETAIANEKWQYALAEQVDVTRSDPRIVEALQKTGAVDYTEAKQALYEFGYRYNVLDVYLTRTEEPIDVIYPATALTPEGQLLSAVRERDVFGSHLLSWGNEVYVMVIQPVVDPHSRKSFGKLTVLYPVESIIGEHFRPILADLGQAETMLMYQSRVESPKLIRHIFWPEQRAVEGIESGIMPILAQPSGSYEAPGFDRSLLGIVHLSSYPGWSVLLKMSRKQALEVIKVWQGIILALTALTAVVVFIWPIVKRLNSAKALRMVKKQKSKMTESGAIDYRDINQTSLSVEAKKKSTPVMNREKSPERKLADVIEASLELNRTKLLFQPIIESNSGKVVYHEVFLRILDAQNKVITPDLFVPVAQRYKLFSKIDAHVMERVVKEHIRHMKKATPMAINLGADTFDSMAFFERFLEQIDINISDKIILELRSREMSGDKKAFDFVRSCQDLGCHCSTDYFGGGTAMLNAAKRVGFDFVKMDSLDITTTEKKKDLIRLAAAAKEAGLPLILERVENQDMVNLASKTGVPFVQGYYVTKPQESPLELGTILRQSAEVSDQSPSQTEPAEQKTPPRRESKAVDPDE